MSHGGYGIEHIPIEDVRIGDWLWHDKAPHRVNQLRAIDKYRQLKIFAERIGASGQVQIGGVIGHETVARITSGV